MVLALYSLITTLAENSSMAKTSESTQYHAKKISNLPEIIRDGLHLYQYYGLTRLYLRNFELEKAKICLEKLKEFNAQRHQRKAKYQPAKRTVA